MTRRQQQPRQQRRIVPALPGREVLPPRRAGACLAPCPQGGARVGAAPCPQDATAALQLCVGCQARIRFVRPLRDVTKPPRFLGPCYCNCETSHKGSSSLRSRKIAIAARRTTTGPVERGDTPRTGGRNQAQHKRAHSVSTGARTSHRPDETQGVQGQGAAARRSAGFDYRNRVPSDPNRQVSGDRTQDNPPLSETESEPETMTTKCRLLSRDECTVSFNVKEPSPSQPETLWLQVQLELPLHVTELHVAWESPTSRHLRPLCYARGGP